MPHFLFKKPKTFSVKFEEIEDDAAPETPFWEIQRAEVLDILTTFFSSWQISWNNTKNALTSLNLTPEDLRRLDFYENEQKRTVIHLLAEILVSWEKDDQSAFSAAVFDLAKELRPSLNHFETSGSDALALSPFEDNLLKNFVRSEAASLKSAVEQLQRLSWHKLEFGDKVLSVSNAEKLLEEKLGLSYFEFLDFSEEPEFNSRGFYPALLQASTDFGL